MALWADARPASVSAWSNDGACGAGLFQGDQFFQTYEEIGESLAATMAEESKTREPEPLRLPFPLGPVAMLSPRAVSKVAGWPAGTLTEALAEWGLVAGASGMEHHLAMGAWVTAMAQETMDPVVAAARGIPFSFVPGSLRAPHAMEWRRDVEMAHAKRTHEVPSTPGTLGQVLETWLAFYGGATDEFRMPVSVGRVTPGEPLPDSKWLRFDWPGCLIGDPALAEMEAAGEESGADIVYADWMAAIEGKGALPVFLTARMDPLYLMARDFVTATMIVRREAWGAEALPEFRTEAWRQVLASTWMTTCHHVPKVLGVAAENMDLEGRIEALQAMYPQ